jgi:hypothetical protein
LNVEERTALAFVRILFAIAGVVALTRYQNPFVAAIFLLAAIPWGRPWEARKPAGSGEDPL